MLACLSAGRAACVPADPFNRWEAGQRLGKKLLVKLYEAAGDSKKVSMAATPDAKIAVKTYWLSLVQLPLTPHCVPNSATAGCTLGQ